MSILDFIQMVLRNKVWVIYFPIIVGTGVFFLTRNTPHTYSSETVIYTGIASGFNPDNGFENKVDFHAVNSRFDNLVNIIGSHETKKDIGLKLLAFFLNHPADLKTFLDNTKNDKLTKLLDEKFVKRFRKESEQATEEYLNAQILKGPDSEIFQLVYGNMKNAFNVKNLEDIKAERQGFSDMLKLSYSCEDPLTCKKTLDIATEIFLHKYQDMRVGEANQAVKYFREQTNEAKEKLRAAEENIKAFRSANGVINYYEQTKYIADEKEKIDQNESQLEMELRGFQQSIDRIEIQMNYKVVMELQSEKIVQARDKLAKEVSKVTLAAVKDGTAAGTTAEIEAMKKALKENVDNLYALNNTKEGIPSKNLLEEWLKLTISKEETAAKLSVLGQKKDDFGHVFDRYAPMGSELSKLEREVETSEKEYLNLLHNLNQAILRENNLKVSESVSVIDEADMPIIPNPSKRIVMVIASVLSCIILAVVLLIVSEYMDRSLGSPLRLEKALGIGCGTAFMSRAIHPEAHEEMDRRSLDRWGIAVNDVMHAHQGEALMLTVPFNCKVDDVKMYTDKLNAAYNNPDYTFTLTSSDRIGEEMKGGVMMSVDKIFPEQQPRAIMQDAKAVFIFFDATQKLDEYQMQVIDAWKKTGLTLKGVLINAGEQSITRYLGEIPRKRGKLRTFVKKMILRYAN